MVGMGIIEAEPEISKILKLQKDWRVMIAGDDIAPAFPIVESAERKLARLRRALAVEDVEKAVCESYSEERARLPHHVVQELGGNSQDDSRPPARAGFNSNWRISLCRLFTWIPSSRAASP